MPSSPPLLRIAARSVRKNARHGAGSILAVAVGFIAIALFDGYRAFIEKDLSDAISERVMVKDVLVERHGAIDLRQRDRKSTRLNSSHVKISYAVFCLKKKKKQY